MTHTLAIMTISPEAFNEIREKLLAVGYDHAIVDADDLGTILDMHTIGLAAEHVARKLEAGKVYTDNGGRELPPMQVGTKPDEFCTARKGDGRYYNPQGVCLRIYGQDNGGAGVQPDESFNITL